MVVKLDYARAGDRPYINYYRYSNRASFDGVAFGVLGGLVTGLPAAIVCAGFPEGSIIFVIYGLILGSVPPIIMRWGKVRSLKISLTVVGVNAAICYAFYCFFWSYQLINRVIGEMTFFEFLQAPALMFQVILANAPMLLCVGLVQAAIVFGAALFVAVRFQSKEPFCEKCQTWCPGRTLRELRMSDYVKLKNAMESADWGYFDHVGRALSVRDYISIIHHQCPICQRLNTLSAIATESSVDSQGNDCRVAKEIVKKLLVSAKDLRAATPTG